MNLLQLALLALILLLLLRLGWRAIHLIEPGNRIRRLLLQYFPVMEMGLWLWLIFLAADVVFTGLPYKQVVMASMTLILLFVLAWYLLRDFFSGMMMKTERAFQKGQLIRTAIASGKIHKLGYRCLILETDQGEKIRIPYTQLSDQLLNLPAEEEASHSHVIELLVKRNTQAELIRRQINAHLLNMPWVISGFPPLVHLSVKDEDHFMVEIRFNVIRKEHVIMVEESLRRYAEELIS